MEPVRTQPSDLTQRISLVSLGLVTAELYFGREVLIPLALALLVTFILTPLVQRLQRFGLPRVPAVLLVVALVFSLVGVLGWTMGRQLVDLARTLPNYERNIRAKVASVRGGEPGALTKAKETVEHIQEDLGVPSPGTPAPPKGARALPPEPARVTIVEPEPTPIAVLRETVFPLLGPLGTAGLVIVFVIFMMIQREDLRDRLLRLVGQGRLNTTTQALDEAAQRVSRYLLMQSLVNGGTGFAVGLGLFFLGVPNAVLWGLLAAVLRFIPYLGPWVAAALPILISIAVFPSWHQTLLTVGLFLVIELVSNNVVEPLLYGSETGISTIGILVAAVFWTWLWGPVGLLLSTPFTVCLVVIGRYVPQLQFLNVLLGDEPPLPLEAQIYHRLLAMDPIEVGNVMETCVKEKTVAEFYDGVLIPALILAERDRHRGDLSPEREEFIETTVRDWIEEFSSRIVEDGSLGPQPADKAAAEARLVCVPADDAADELTGHMFAQLAVRGGTPTVLEHGLPRAEVLRRVAELGAEQVFISALAPFAYAQAREVCRDLRRHFPGMRIVVALWDLRSEADRLRRRLVASGADEVVATLQDAVLAIRLAQAPAADPAALLEHLLQAFRDGDVPSAEKVLAEAEQQLPVETLAVEVLDPALTGLSEEWVAGKISDEREQLAGNLLRERVTALAEAAPAGRGLRALAFSAPEEQRENGSLILALLLRRAGWSLVYFGQREEDEGLDEVIASVQPHALLFSAALREKAEPLLELAKRLHAEYPELLLVFSGRGFRPEAVSGLGEPVVLVPADTREAVATIERLMPADGPKVNQAA
jgi:predicted PurR-regulated permease PerM/methanogenic corrinoid protein MtbC1